MACCNIQKLYLFSSLCFMLIVINVLGSQDTHNTYTNTSTQWHTQACKHTHTHTLTHAHKSTRLWSNLPTTVTLLVIRLQRVCYLCKYQVWKQVPKNHLKLPKTEIIQASIPVQWIVRTSFLVQVIWLLGELSTNQITFGCKYNSPSLLILPHGF